jgi:hypothetical protein
MSEVGTESCPVCWREYSSFTKPFLIVCGHTFCQDCLSDLKNCPICRARIPAKYPGATNYSLLSMIERKPDTQHFETAHAETQTEQIDEQPSLEPQLPPQVRLVRPKSVATRKAKKAIKFKMIRTETGELDSLEVTLS